jgi:hypothetical protein
MTMQRLMPELRAILAADFHVGRSRTGFAAGPVAGGARQLQFPTTGAAR